MSEDREIMPVCVECEEPFGWDERLCPAHAKTCPRYLDEHAEEHHCCSGLGTDRPCCRVCHPQAWELRSMTEEGR